MGLPTDWNPGASAPSGPKYRLLVLVHNEYGRDFGVGWEEVDVYDHEPIHEAETLFKYGYSVEPGERYLVLAVNVIQVDA